MYFFPDKSAIWYPDLEIESDFNHYVFEENYRLMFSHLDLILDEKIT